MSFVKMQNELITRLTADHAVGESHDVGVGPGALGPRLDVLQVVREVDGVKLVVHELADVPRQVVVAGSKRKKKENMGWYMYGAITGDWGH